MTPDEAIRSVVRDELASLGGHLLADHGPTAAHPNPTLATLGGFLTGYYGTTARVAYRDPDPPAVGEPPTTTPGGDT